MQTTTHTNTRANHPTPNHKWSLTLTFSMIPYFRHKFSPQPGSALQCSVDVNKLFNYFITSSESRCDDHSSPHLHTSDDGSGHRKDGMEIGRWGWVLDAPQNIQFINAKPKLPNFPAAIAILILIRFGCVVSFLLPFPL